MQFFSTIIEKFGVKQRLWALVVLAICFISVAAIKIVPETFGNHNCTECRQDIRKCNQDYAELAGTVREFIQLNRESEMKAVIAYEAAPVEEYVEIDSNGVEEIIYVESAMEMVVPEKVPEVIKEKNKAIDKMEALISKE